MSRIGIGANKHTPNSQCLSCKRWKGATKKDFFFGVSEEGHCTLGYCEKTKNRKK